MFKIVNGSGYSLDDIHRFKARGGSVVRSAHIGNLTLGTIFLAEEGFKVLLHEHLRGSNPYYRPGYLKTGKSSIRLLAKCKSRAAQLGEIRKEAIPGEIRDFLSGSLAEVRTPAALHWQVLHKINTNFQLLSSYLLQYNEWVAEALEIVADHLPSLFGLYIDDTGHDYRLEKIIREDLIYVNQKQESIKIRRKDLASMACQYLLHTQDRITKHATAPSGLLLNDVLALLLISLIEWQEAGNGQGMPEYPLIHIAGKKMMDYLLSDDPTAVSNRKLINQLFGLLKQNGSISLPDSLSFILIPSDRFEWLVNTDPNKTVNWKKSAAFMRASSADGSKSPDKTQYDLVINRQEIFFPENARSQAQVL